MGYLICKNGRILQTPTRRKPEDFTECQCGGELTYKENLTGKKDTPITSIVSKNEDKSQSNKKKPFFPRLLNVLIAIFVVIIVLSIKFVYMTYILRFFWAFFSQPYVTFIFVFFALLIFSILYRKYLWKY